MANYYWSPLAVAVYQLDRNRDYIKMVSFRNDDIKV